ncbi:hypothetical protein ACCI51_11330 [Microbulbifer echini]|uniref:Uncharacterized protein n=1 Tax=Microbulbifer echini TaxID=1529067 RepID=A0ABV4NNL8_9GAMM
MKQIARNTPSIDGNEQPAKALEILSMPLYIWYVCNITAQLLGHCNAPQMLDLTSSSTLEGEQLIEKPTIEVRLLAAETALSSSKSITGICVPTYQQFSTTHIEHSYKFKQTPTQIITDHGTMIYSQHKPVFNTYRNFK